MVIQPIAVRKVPIEAKAILWDGTVLPMDELNRHGANLNKEDIRITRDGLRIRTLHGFSYATVGDWLIIAPWGEVYPVKPEVFAAVYEEVECTTL